MSLEFNEDNLIDLCELVTDGSHHSPPSQVEGYYMASVKDMGMYKFNYSDCRKISQEDYEKLVKTGCSPKNNDILIAKDGSPLSNIFIYEEEHPMVLLSSIAIIRTNENRILPKYLKYYLQNPSIKKYIQTTYTSGSVIPRIILKDFKKFPINYPNIENQNRIINILETIDKKIEVNENINKNLQNLIKILYKEYFESFELNNVPDDWELVNIGSIIDIYNGYSYKGTELQESDCGMVTIKNFNRDGSFRIDGFKEIVYSNKIKKHHFINENDVLISCTDVTQDADIIGNCIIVLDKQNYDELIMSMDLVKIESKISEINNFLLASIFKSYNFKKHILGHVNGTTVLHLDKKGIKKFKIALPKDLSELKNISERFELIYAEIQCNQKEINKLTKLRDTLLPKLMSGEIDVSKIEM